MNKKGAMTIGALVLVFVGVVFSLALIEVIGNEVGGSTQTRTIVNDTVTTASTANATVSITGRSNPTGYAATNVTHDDVSSQFEIVEVLEGTTQTLELKTLDAAVAAGNNGDAINVSYTYEPSGYMDGASASMFKLVTLFAVLALLAFVIFGSRIKEAFDNLR